MNSAILHLPLRGLTDGTDGFKDAFAGLISLGFCLGKVGINHYYPDLTLVTPVLDTKVKIYRLPKGWRREGEPDYGHITDEKDNLRVMYNFTETTLFPRFQLRCHAKKLHLVDAELKGDGIFSSINVFEMPMTNQFYRANYLEIDSIIDAHLPNLGSPFDHWDQDRTHAIQSLQKELGILVQSTPKKFPFKKNLPYIQP